MPDTQPDVRISRLSLYFQGHDTQFGVFYPRGYLMVVFPHYEAATNAEKQVRRSGIAESEVIAVPGEDLLAWAEEHKRGVLNAVMGQLSKMFATEEVYHEQDVEHAKRGAGFLLARCPSQSAKQTVWRILQDHDMLAARHYSLGGVEHLKGENLP